MSIRDFCFPAVVHEEATSLAVASQANLQPSGSWRPSRMASDEVISIKSGSWSVEETLGASVALFPPWCG